MVGTKALAKAAGVKAGLIDDVIAAIVRLTRNGERVSLRGFGAFYAHLHRGRTQVTPLVQGGEVTYSDRLVLKFKPSRSAKQRMNLAVHDKGSRPKGKKKHVQRREEQGNHQSEGPHDQGLRKRGARKDR